MMHVLCGIKNMVSMVVFVKMIATVGDNNPMMGKTVVKSRPATRNLSRSMSSAFTHLHHQNH